MTAIFYVSLLSSGVGALIGLEWKMVCEVYLVIGGPLINIRTLPLWHYVMHELYVLC